MQWPLCFVYFFQSLLVHCDYCYQKHKPSFHTFFKINIFILLGVSSAYFKTFLSTTFNPPPPIELILPPIRPHEIFYKSPEFYWMSVQSITLSYPVPINTQKSSHPTVVLLLLVSVYILIGNIWLYDLHFTHTITSNCI